VSLCMPMPGSTTTITADSVVDKFLEASCKGGTLIQMGCACSTDGHCVVLYHDASADPAVIIGYYVEDRIIDVRSTTTSATYDLLLFPIFNADDEPAL